MPGVALGELPALPLHTAGKYVAGAYVVLFALVLVYVAIMAVRLSRIERELGELLELSENHRTETPERDRSEIGGQDVVGHPESTRA
jgi:CcmD family protein